MAFQSTQVWGNLISSAVFQFGGTTIEQTNNSFCGANFCPSYQKVSNTGNDTMVGSSKPDDNLEVILVSNKMINLQL
jgi:hypothetical protein